MSMASAHPTPDDDAGGGGGSVHGSTESDMDANDPDVDMADL